MATYAGIGSRETPDKILTVMEEIALVLGEQGLTLCSGHAIGADQAFERGARDYHACIYLPWPGFNKAVAIGPKHILSKQPSKIATEAVSSYHPGYKYLTGGAKKLHARNVEIMLGKNTDHPVDFMVCWTPLGKATGGTAQGIRIANEHGIPIFNLGDKQDYNHFSKLLYNESLPGMDHAIPF